MSLKDDEEGPWGHNGDDNKSNPWIRKPNRGGDKNGADIEELFKKSQDQFKTFFRKGGKGSGRTLWYVAGGIFFLWLLTGIYTVQQDEQGVVLRFGKWVRTTDPGLNYHLPTPFETVYVRNVTAINILTNTTANQPSTGNLSGEGALMLTGDENIADVQFAVNWRIKDLGEFLFNVKSPETTIRAAADSIVRSVIAQTPIAQILSEGRSKINIQLREMLQKLLDDYKLGVEISQVELLKVTPPTAKVMDAYLDVQRAKADMERKRNEAEYYRNSIVPVARGAAKKITQDSEAYKAKVMADIDGETSRFQLVYDQYKLAPEVTGIRLYIDTMQTILEKAQKLLVDGDKSQGVLPYLPLPGLNRAPEKTEEVAQ